MYTDDEAVRTNRFSYKEFGKFYQYLSVLDLCFSNFIIAPLVITFWCKTAAVVFGFLISLLFTLFQKQLQATFEEHVTNKFLYFLGSCSHTYLFGCASVSIWHGLWSLVDQLTQTNLNAIIAVVIISYIGLAFSRTSCNIRSSPFVIFTDFDKKRYNFEVPTYFQSLKLQSTYKLLLLDVIFSIIVVGTLISTTWRGTWFLLDLSLNYFEELTNLISLEIGYFVALFAYFLQSPVERWVRKTSGWKGLIILDIYILITFCGVVNIWRGVWNTIAEWTHLEDSLCISILLHWVSFLVLVVCNASSTLSIRGLNKEAVENVVECVEFPLFLRLHFQNKRDRSTEESKRTSDMEHGVYENEGVSDDEFKMNGIGKTLESDTTTLPLSEVRSIN